MPGKYKALPLHDRIIVQRIDEGEQHVGGIISRRRRIVPGGGVALLRASKVLQQLKLEGDE
jgi:hypothetical protein